MRFLNPTLLISILLPVSACSDDNRLYTATEPHMGTEITFRVWATDGDRASVDKAFEQAFARVEALNHIFSDYLPESEINLFAKAPSGEPVILSQELFHLFSVSADISRQSSGAFDVTSGPFIRLWRLSKKNRRLPTEDQITSARARSGTHLLGLDPETNSATKLSEGMLFDFGGIAKGYAADEALKVLKEAGFSRALVAASGDITVGDPPPGKDFWKVEIQAFKNLDQNSEPVVVRLANAAVSTSGDTTQYIELGGTRFSHIVSPLTGLGMTERIAASVIAPTATLSDSYATTVTLLGEKEGLQFIENKREIECRIVALRNAQEVVVTSHGFSQLQEEKRQEESAVTPP